MSTPGQVRGGAGGWPVLVRCEIGRAWLIGIDSHVPGVIAVRDGLELSELTIAQLAQCIATQSRAAMDLRNGAWVDARVLLADLDTGIEQLRVAVARYGDRTLNGVRLTESIAALQALSTWVLTLAGGEIDDLPPGQTRDPYDWRYTRLGTPVTLPAPMTSVHTRAGQPGMVVDAWIDLDTRQAVLIIETLSGQVREVEPVTTDTVPVRTPAGPRLGRVWHVTTAEQMRTQITVLLDEAGDGLDVDVQALVADLVARHGPIHPKLVPSEEFWTLVAAHARPDRQEPAGGQR